MSRKTEPTGLEGLADYAKALAAGIQTIPADEVIACLRGNLTAVRRIRLGKDPDGVEEPDYNVRQKAVDTILSITVPQRKAVDPPAPKTTEEAGAPVHGRLKASRE